MDPQRLEQRTQEIGREIFARARKHDHLSVDRFLERRLMKWGMGDEQVKAHLFRFVDVLPALTSAGQINQHLRDYLLPVRDRLPTLAGHALGWLHDEGWVARRVADAARAGAGKMARRFIAATGPEEAVVAAEKLRARQMGFTADLLGEAVLSEAEALAYQQRYFDMLNGLCDAAEHWSDVPLVDRDDRGQPLARVNVSIKLSSLFSQFDPIDPAGVSEAVRQRLRPIFKLARQRGAFVNVDMEQYTLKDLTLRIFREILEEPDFADWADVGIAIQGYLRSSGDDLRALAAWSERRGTRVWVRLVKGAYWDYETVIAAQNDWPVPVFSHKNETDANYEAQSAFLLERSAALRPAIASHNVRSISAALARAELLGLPARSYEFQMLHGMAEPVKRALVEMGHRVRVYMPVGALLPGMAYLVRRLLENTSNESFLRAGFIEQAPEEQLLMNPSQIKSNGQASPMQNHQRPASDQAALEPFHNEPVSDFSRQDARQRMAQALSDVRQVLGRRFTLVIGGERVESARSLDSIDPSDPSRVVAHVASATVEHANQAVDAALGAFDNWRDTPARQRAQLLINTAAVLRRRRFELAAWEVFETAKPWREADADVAEAIDFCEYYARQMVLLDEQGDGRDVPGEDNCFVYEPRGVTVVIAPWNFPLAILCGMSAAALVTGNTVIMKPAEQSPAIAGLLMEAFEEAGFPPGVVNYLPGVGEEIGPALVGHRDVAMIAFTGSRAVGLAIQAQAAQMQPGQDHIKHVITELGGKNAVIVDDDADLDEAVAGIVASAFGYAGQKCSACSRAIVLDSVYDAVINRLVEATASLHVGAAEDPATTVPAVIDAEAKERIERAIAEAKTTPARLVYAGEPPTTPTEGYFVAPYIFADVSPDAPLAREEVFGPVLAVLRAGSFDEALKIANSTTYALTGGVYSRNPAHVAQARRQFRVGNLYINRKITGALVGRQPFGGFKLSGGGTKAGGADYLLQFLMPRTITENTLRRGFATSGATRTDASPPT